MSFHPARQGFASAPLELIDLATTVKSLGESLPNLAFVVDATSEAYQKVHSIRPRINQILWPPSIYPDGEQLTPNDWLGFLLCIRACEVSDIPLPNPPTDPPGPETQQPPAAKS
jgi:hypothetical protein